MNLLKASSKIDTLKEDLPNQLDNLKKHSSYSEIAQLLAHTFKNTPQEINHQVFGYIPRLFREIELKNAVDRIDISQVYIGEPVIYKIGFPEGQAIKGIPFFYVFCYLKETPALNVYFQSEAAKNKLVQKQYTLADEKIIFEGIASAFQEPESVICISDPGHFIPELASSFYIGSKTINFPQIISSVIENICNVAKIKLSNTFLFGSSAGGIGALLSSTYFSSKVHVMSVNAQITTHNLAKVIKTLLETDNRDTITKQYSDRVSCLHRFRQNISSVPNIYILSDINNSTHEINFDFFQLYQRKFALSGTENQSIFDSYVDIGHGCPNKALLKTKIKIARTILTMRCSQANSSLSALPLINKNENLAIKEQRSQLPPQVLNLDAYQTKLSRADNLYRQSTLESQLISNQIKQPNIGQLSRDEVAIAGKESWLYIYGGSNNLLKYHTGEKQISADKIIQWKNLLKQRIEWHQAHNIKYQHLFVPNKIAVYPEYYPHQLKHKRDRPIVQLRKNCQQTFLYPKGVFLKQKGNYRLYNRQDCHWNFWGCYLAYHLICHSLEIQPNEQLLDSPIEVDYQKGDLGSKFGVKERLLNVNLQYNSRITFDNQLINYCHQGSVRTLKNDRIAHGKMIIFGDSFSNPGFPNYTRKRRNAARLTSLFAETLNEVHFVWTPWIDYDYIEREKPDFVLTEMAERFLIRVPDDRDHLPLEEFAAMKLKEHQSKQK